MKQKTYQYIFFIFILFQLTACFQIDLEEKHVFIPEYKWYYNFSPSLKINVKDTITQLKVYIIVKFQNDYEYQNLWLNLGIKAPSDTATTIFKVNNVLSTNERGWLGSGFSNIYENRIFWNRLRFKEMGEYEFSFQQIMRDNPLSKIISIGIRIEP